MCLCNTEAQKYQCNVQRFLQVGILDVTPAMFVVRGVSGDTVQTRHRVVCVHSVLASADYLITMLLMFDVRNS